MSKKIMMTVFILATLFCVSLIFALNLEFGGMDSRVIISVFGNALESSGNAVSMSPEKILSYIYSGIAIAIFFISLFISLFSVSSLFPDMLKKGSIDLTVSKPVSRNNVFMQRFSGGITAVMFNVFYITLLSWLILSFKFGIWDISFVLSGIIIMIFFFNIFSLMTMIAVFVKNSVISLLLTYFLVFILSPIVGLVDRFGASKGTVPGIITGILNGSLPKVNETVVYINSVMTGGSPSHSVLWSAVLSGIIFTSISLTVFKKSDF